MNGGWSTEVGAPYHFVVVFVSQFDCWKKEKNLCQNHVTNVIKYGVHFISRRVSLSIFGYHFDFIPVERNTQLPLDNSLYYNLSLTWRRCCLLLHFSASSLVVSFSRMEKIRSLFVSVRSIQWDWGALISECSKHSSLKCFLSNFRFVCVAYIVSFSYSLSLSFYLDFSGWKCKGNFSVVAKRENVFCAWLLRFR